MHKVKAMPHVWIKDKGDVDLYFEFLDKEDRQAIVDDLGKGVNIKLPDFGQIGSDSPYLLGEKIDVHNEVKEIKKEDLPEKMWGSKSEDFLKSLTKGTGKSEKPILTYDKSEHKYKLKPKYDIEKMIKEFVENQTKKVHPLHS
jgi:hypothetical protein